MATSRILLPERPRRYRFAMTPLADAMFQLLIFFMLSSSLTPYSMITLQTAEAPPEPGNAGAPAPAAPAPDTGETAIWALENGRVLVGGQSFDFDALDGLAAALGASGVPQDVLLLVRDSAQVQDVTTVLERLRAANVGAVRVAQGAY
ncbi:ExbD/TolR family protein [Tropicibacter alexandrii]|uniref:ExbD/TolR family protein n=1 Tax=Tropicibacter alexandrii TaxID=2267683 RepID=UPI000EF488B7|nr:biopolymer transporter ExbD [Tropicibacter alexandrii]